MKTELKGKYLIAFDTICEGHQTSKDENGQPCPTLYDSYDEAFKELFTDAVCGIEGNEEHFMDDMGYDLDDEDDEERYNEDLAKRNKIIADMNALIKEGDSKKMQDFMDNTEDCNYYEDFIEKADEFILGRKAIFTGQGLVIEGTKLEDL